MERLFLSRFESHILSSPNFNKNQSAYRPRYSTETSLQLLLDNIYSTADAGKLTLLVSLDLSAAFDTIDHAVLLKRLNCSFGIAGTVHSWLVLPVWQVSVCENWHPFITCYLISSWRPSRLSPWAATFLCLHLTYFHHHSVSPFQLTAIC